MATVFRVLAEYDSDTVLIHGAARGADRHADAYGQYRHWEVHPEPAEWTKYGKAAGPIRNQLMLDKYQPDVCHAFHDDLAHSKGTRDMVERAEKAGIPVHVHASTLAK
jgi:imidazolonepropionase-like amidohydrolase